MKPTTLFCIKGLCLVFLFVATVQAGGDPGPDMAVAGNQAAAVQMAPLPIPEEPPVLDREQTKLADAPDSLVLPTAEGVSDTSFQVIPVREENGHLVPVQKKPDVEKQTADSQKTTVLQQSSTSFSSSGANVSGAPAPASLIPSYMTSIEESQNLSLPVIQDKKTASKDPGQILLPNMVTPVIDTVAPQNIGKRDAQVNPFQVLATGKTNGLISVPTSAKAETIMASVRPKLEADLADKGFAWGTPLFIRIFKETKSLEVWLAVKGEYRLYKTYKICRFSGGFGPKQKAGDKQSPEGFYRVTPAQLNPHSNYHLAFNLGFPNPYDAALGRTGSMLMVHGNCGSRGCYAMNDQQIEEIYTLADAALKNGQPYFQVHVFPFKLTEKQLAKFKNNQWFDFWANLKQGYELFEERKLPPLVMFGEKKYQFF